MKERLKKERKIIVYKADSTEQEIRFFVNENQFVKATEEGDYIVVETGINSETDSKKSFVEFVEIVKEHKKIFAIVLFCLILFCLVHLLIASFVPMIALISFGILLPIFTILEIGILEYGRTTFLERSKHSAEHMMINFLEANLRLPKNIQEIKSVSRFSKSCGSRFITVDLVKNTIPYIISLLEALICTVILSQIENFINQGLNYSFQCCNTTKKVRQEDIIVAFYAAKHWLKIVYPEFFSDDKFYCEENENEDI